MTERVVIGNAELWHGDCREVLPLLPKVDAVITDPPYSDRCHRGHDSTAKDCRDGSLRASLGYQALSLADVAFFAAEFDRTCAGWIVWMTDSDLALHVRSELDRLNRTTFAPLPFFQAGRSVRLAGDGPSSWTDWIVVARTKAQAKWGTLPGGYIAGAGWNDKARMGGKPTLLMDALVADYSRVGDVVLDTHMGAGTTGVSCVNAGRKFIGCEIDRAAFDIACERISRAQAQGQMFEPEPPKAEQAALL